MLGSSEVVDYGAGRHTFVFEVGRCLLPALCPVPCACDCGRCRPCAPCCYRGLTRVHLPQVPRIDVSSVKRSRLANAGLLSASLTSGGRDVVDVNMVVQVQEDRGVFVRTVFNPLE